ncbi:MAG TPA: GatB/YqeY domain-containing protein [Lysobacter sp.]
MSLKQRLTDDMKAAMKSGDKASLGVIRLMLAAIKQREVDERIELDDAQVLAALDKMVKQRRDSVSQYEAAGRTDLADIEKAEIVVIDRYLPAKLDEAAIIQAIDAAVAQVSSESGGATSAADIGKLMGVLKPKLAGQADMGLVSKLVKQRLAS